MARAIATYVVQEVVTQKDLLEWRQVSIRHWDADVFYSYSLLLSSGKFSALVSNVRLISIGERHDEVMGVR